VEVRFLLSWGSERERSHGKEEKLITPLRGRVKEFTLGFLPENEGLEEK